MRTSLILVVCLFLFCTSARAQVDLINLGSTTVGADSDEDQDGAIKLQTQNRDRLIINNDGTLTVSGPRLTLGIATGLESQTPARLDFLTTESPYSSLMSQSYLWTNQPSGPKYFDHVSRWSHNGQEGAKQVAGEVQFELTRESKWWSGTQWQTELYWSWTSPDNSKIFRPWGLTINHDTGASVNNMMGQVWFQREYPNHSDLFATFNDGALDLTYRSNSVITFPNNGSGGLAFRNAANSNSIPVIKLNASDQVVLAPGGQHVVIPGTMATIGDTGSSRLNIIKVHSRTDANTYIDLPGLNWIRFFSNGVAKLRVEPNGTNVLGNLYYGTDNTFDFGKDGSFNFRPRDGYFARDVDAAGAYKVGGVKVLGNQCLAIADSTGTTADNQRAINAILGCLRTHGIVAP